MFVFLKMIRSLPLLHFLFFFGRPDIAWKQINTGKRNNIEDTVIVPEQTIDFIYYTAHSPKISANMLTES